MWPLTILAIEALIGDLVVHIATFLGFDPSEWIQPEWFGGVFFFGVLMLITALGGVAKVRMQARAKQQGETLEKRRPRWFVIVRRIVIVYAIFNLAVWGIIKWPSGNPIRTSNGGYALDPGHGKAVQPISADEFHRYRREEVRGLSGFVLIFYVQIAFDMTVAARSELVEKQKPRVT